jgi:hypothetical protein
VITAQANCRLQASSGSAIGSQPFGVTIVAKNNGNQHVYFDTYSGTSARAHCYQFGGGNKIYANSETGGAAKTNNWTVYYFEWNGASSKIYINGTIDVTVSPGTAGAGTNICFMNVAGGGVPPDLATLFAEAKISTGTQSSGDVLSEANALRAKWGF